VIYKEIKWRDELKVSHQMQEEVLLHLQKQLENCSRNRKESVRLETLRKWLQEGKTQAFFSVVRSFFNSCTKKLFSTGMKFSDSEISRLQAELSNKRAVHLRSDALTLHYTAAGLSGHIKMHLRYFRITAE